jgi:hypothetical protein
MMAMRGPQFLTLSLAVQVAVAFALTACAGVGPNPTPPYIIPDGPGDPAVARIGGADSGVIFRFPNNRPAFAGGAPGIGVNPFLWRGALETLSSLPLVSADPFGGVIITDWYSPANAQGERFKETAIVTGRGLQSDAVRVSVFRQVSRGGTWLDAPVDPAVQTDLQNRVLDRARLLRQQATSQG